MRPPHFRLRTLMIAVAVVGVGLTLAERHRRFQRLAAYHATKEGELRSLGGGLAPPMSLIDGNSGAMVVDEWDYHVRLRRKYERAARCPWLSVEPDPPSPSEH